MASHTYDADDYEVVDDRDPWVETDPWGDYNRSAAGANAPPYPSERRPYVERGQRRSPQAMIGAVGTAFDQPPPSRMIHDIPPVWSGDHPEGQLEPYIKLLTGWLATTRTLNTQQGMTILHYSTGDLKVVINELDVTVLTAEDSGAQVLKHVQAAYSEYLEKKLPAAIERGLFDRDLARRKGESMLQYCTRRNTLFKQLAKEGWEIPDIPKGYILLRDANLPEKARDLIEMWSGGTYEYPQMQVFLKRLELPIPGTFG